MLAATAGGKELAGRLIEGLAGTSLVPGEKGVARALQDNWEKYDAFFCIMATGIVVRSIAPLLKDKAVDPAVLVLDEKGQFVISLLSGHLGGANELARRVALFTGGRAVVTTASDTLGLPALDVWARDSGLVSQDRKKLTQAMAQLVNSGSLSFFLEVDIAGLPAEFRKVPQVEDADVIVSCRNDVPHDKLVLHPVNLVAGVGCNRGTKADQIRRALFEACEKNCFSQACIRNLASIDLKADEDGLLSFARQEGYRVDFYSKDELNRVENVSSSPAVIRQPAPVVWRNLPHF